MGAWIRPLLLLPLALLTGCAGADCDFDDECLSGSCSWGTCDSALVEGIAESIRDRSSDEPTAPASLHCVRVGESCQWLPKARCEDAPDCAYVPTFCIGGPSQTYPDCYFDDDCPTPCGTRSAAECDGRCQQLYTCEPLPLACHDFDEAECESHDGCALRTR